jgi:uncharacterized protein YcbK (DUF882 family)
MTKKDGFSRRGLLRVGFAAAAAGLVLPSVANAAGSSHPLPARKPTLPNTLTAGKGSAAKVARSNVRSLHLVNLHTGEELKTAYFNGTGYDQTALQKINFMLRDHRNNAVTEIDPALLDLLHALRGRLDTAEAFQVVSGYRSPQTNAMLVKQQRGVAKHSLHMSGQAIDIRLENRSISAIRDAAYSLKKGGVGFYGRSNFVHVDVGPVRSWGWRTRDI